MRTHPRMSLPERYGAPPAATSTTGTAAMGNTPTGGAAESQRCGRNAAGGISRIPTSAKFVAFEDGSLEIHFYDGRAERWQR